MTKPSNLVSAVPDKGLKGAPASAGRLLKTQHTILFCLTLGLALWLAYGFLSNA